MAAGTRLAGRMVASLRRLAQAHTEPVNLDPTLLMGLLALRQMHRMGSMVRRNSHPAQTNLGLHTDILNPESHIPRADIRCLLILC